MLYAICVEKEQLCDSKEEFEKRKNEGGSVKYCINETTYCENGVKTYPLNYIFGKIQKGPIILLLKENTNDEPYSMTQSYDGVTKILNHLTPFKSLNVNDKTTLDYIFNEINNSEIIYPSGYVQIDRFMSADVYNHYKELMDKYKPC